MPLSQRVTNMIWGRSGGRCYLDPAEELSRTPSGNLPIGEIAHIVAENLAGPRGAFEMAADERNSIENVLLLCPNHHQEIDNHPEVWTVERLRRLKQQHEEGVRKSLDERYSRRLYLEDDRPGLEINFEKAQAELQKPPRFTFSVKNMWSTSIVVHSLDAEVLALGVRPSTRRTETMNAHSSLTMRTPVTFDFTSVAVGSEVSASAHDAGFLRPFRFDPFEAAIALKPGESESFCASLYTGSFAMGTFRLLATYWNRPDNQQRAASSLVGYFAVPDNDGYGRWFDSPKVASSASIEKASARILSFQEIVDEMTVEEPPPRPLWPDDTFDLRRLLQQTFGRLNYSKAKALIEDFAGRDERRYWRTALEALAAAPASVWKAALVERVLSSSKPAVRAEAVDLVGDFEYTDALETLCLKLLSDPEAEVRLRSVRRLRYTTNPRISAKLHALQHDPDRQVREAAEEFLKKWTT